MIITFFGHSHFHFDSVDEKLFLSIIAENVKDSRVDFYLGGYGEFDSFSYKCCKRYREENKNAGLVFVTPYIDENYQKNHLSDCKMRYDEIIYPALENVPYRYAIVARNRWMVDNADLVIAYVNHSWGGAYNACAYAVSKGKKVINLGKLVF
ncbi:MAG: hypothetical protein E7612_04040 [Ruminococcaceae bacterium]|nr:hypothetical protein [Oscillospiraceae bacterium]